jgi:hypothetical protein
VFFGNGEKNFGARRSERLGQGVGKCDWSIVGDQARVTLFVQKGGQASLKQHWDGVGSPKATE